MHELLEQLEALIEKWENVPYTGDYTKAAKSVCAHELRRVLNSQNANAPREYNLWNPGWEKEKENPAILRYGNVIVRIPYTFIHHLCNILPGAVKGSHLQNLDFEFIRAIGEIRRQMCEEFWPHEQSDAT